MPLFSADGRSVSAVSRRDRTARELRCTTLRLVHAGSRSVSRNHFSSTSGRWIDNERAFAVNRYRNHCTS